MRVRKKTQQNYKKRVMKGNQSTGLRTDILKKLGNPLQLIFIMPSQENKRRLEQLLSELDQKLNQILQLLSFEAISKNYKEICSRLSYFLQHLSFAVPGHSRFTASLRSCMNTLKILLEATEYQKYSHIFPILGTLVRKYELLTSEQLEPVDKPTLVEMIHKKEKSHFHEIFGFDAIQSSQIKFLQSGDFNFFFNHLANQQITLQDPSCVCCSQVFIKNFKILNNNPLLSVVAELSEKKGFDQIVFENYVNAVCNKRGGVIIIGMEKKGEKLIAVGLKFNTIEDILKREAEISMAIVRIKPICCYSIERVLVHTNYLDPKNVAEQNMRICFRVLIFPYEPSKLNYSQISNKGYHKIYQVFKFDNERKPYKVVSTSPQPPQRPQSLYTMMHQKYHEQPVTKNNHQNIKCFRPYAHYSIFFNKYLQNGCPPQNQTSDETEVEVEELGNEDQPKFKYQNVSLLIVGSKKGDRFVDDLRKALIKKKEVFQITKPFQNSFKDGVRSIWMISHKMHFIQLKNFHKGLEVKNILKQNCLIMMPVYKTLQIQKSKFNEYRQQIESKFQNRYNKVFGIETAQVLDQNKKPRTVAYLHFSTLNEAIYAYLIFEMLQLKPYFTKDGNNTEVCQQ